jgi:Family of unknown function (DUF6153)
MTLTTRPLRRVLPGLLAAVVAAIVLGILGMHALNTHAMTMADAGHDATTGHSALLAAGEASADEATVTERVGGHGTGPMQMLCAVMLAAAGALLAVVVALRRSPRRWAHLRAELTALVTMPTALLETRPPPVWEFSVMRC